MHNSTLAIAVGDRDRRRCCAIPAAVYSAFMFITAGLFARLMFRRNGGLTAQPLPAEGG